MEAMNFINRIYFILKNIFLLFIVVLIASCGNSGFIVSKQVLDPFSMYSYQPLSLPPVYYLSSQEIADERRFIKEGQSRVQSLLFENQISDSLLPKKNKKTTLTNSDEKFLLLANANQDLSKVREKLDEESLGITYKDKNFINKIFLEYKGEALDDKFSEYKKYNR